MDECGVVDNFVVFANVPFVAEVEKVKVSVDFMYVALLGKNGVLQVFSLKQENLDRCTTCPIAVQDFIWQQCKGGGFSRLALITKDNCLEVMEIHCGEHLELLNLDTGQKLQPLIDEVMNANDTKACSRATLLEYDDDVITLASPQWHLLSINILEASVMSHLSLDHVTANIKDLQLSSCFVFVLGSDNLYVIARDSGNLLTQLNVYDVVIEMEASEKIPIPSSLAVSADGDVVAVVCADGCVLLISLGISAAEECHSQFSDELPLRDGSLHTSESQMADRVTSISSGAPGTIHEWDSRSSLGSILGLHHSITEDDNCSVTKQRRTALEYFYSTPSFDEDHVVQLLGPSYLSSTAWWSCCVDQAAALAKVAGPCILYNSDSISVHRQLYIPSPNQNLTVQEVQVGTGTLALWYREDTGAATRVTVVDTSSGAVFQDIRFAETCSVALGSRIEHPNLVLSSSEVSVVVGRTSQDKLVNKVMLHHSAAAAESLSRTNHWQRLRLPPALLTLGLNNRQLDTVAFYLKSCCPSSQSANTTDTSELSPAGAEAITNVIASVNLQNATDSTSQVFADQVVKVTLDFLMSFLLALENSSNSQYKSVSDVMMNMVQLRQLLKNPAGHRLHPAAIPSRLPDVTVNSKWMGWTIQAVVQDAILQRRIPTAQSILMDGEQLVTCNMSAFEDLGMKLALESLQRCDWEMAIKVIESLGQDVHLVFKNFCYNTYRHDLRSLLETTLVQQGLLDDNDCSDLQLLRKLEHQWPGQSWEAALKQSAWPFPFTQITSQRKCPCVRSFPVPKLLAFLSSSPLDVSAPCLANTYACLSLRWLKSLNQATRLAIKVDGIIAAGGPPAFESEPPGSILSLWQFWMNYNCTAELCRFIHHICGVSGCVKLSQNLAVEMATEAAETALPYFSDVVLNEFARYGIFHSASYQNLRVVICQLSQIGCVFSCPHPTALNTASLTHVEFLRRFVSFCIQKNLTHVLLQLVDCIPQEQDGLLCDKPEAWLAALLDFTAWERNSYSAQHVLQACLANFGFLCPSSSTISAVLEALADPVACVATLLYNSRPLSQVVVNLATANASAVGQVEKALLQSCLRPKYPQLELAICREAADPVTCDVSVYDLLKVNERFDMEHLFQWRNNSSVPFCSQQEMSRLHGHQVELDFLYYLSQARPCFATAKFLAQELLLKNTLYSQRVNGASALAAGLALKHFMSPSISAACVALVEMLGRDSTWLRVTIEAAQLVANSHDKASPLHCDQRDQQGCPLDIRSLLLAITKQQPQACSTLLELLEDAVVSSVGHLGGFSKVAMEPLVLFGLVAAFCRAHCLPLSSVFLQKYAQESNWLMMLLVAQCHLHSQEDVKVLLNHIADCAVREHLQNILVHLYVKRKAVVTTTHAVHPRDIRHTLYQKIGLAREKRQITAVVAEDQQFSDPEEGMQSSSDDTTDSLSGSTELGVSGLRCHREFMAMVLESAHLRDACQPLLDHALQLNNSSAVLLADCTFEVPTDDTRRLGLLCVWLVTSADEAFLPQISVVSRALQSHVWMPEDFSVLLVIAVEAQRFILLNQGLSLFMPESPLVPLVRFLASVVTGDKKKSSKDWLQDFIQALKSAEGVAVGLSREQLEQTSVNLLCHTVGCCPSLQQAYHFMLTLQRHRVQQHFCTGVLFPDLAHALRLLGPIKMSGISVNVKALLWGKQDLACEAECRRTLSLLIEGFHFGEAWAFSQAAGLGQEAIAVAQLQEELVRRRSLTQWQNPVVRHAFWLHCFKSLLGESNPETTASFLLSMAPSAASHSERFFLLQLALQAQASVRDEKISSSLEADMWNSRFEAELEVEFAGAEGKTFLDVQVPDGVSPHDLLRQGQRLSWPDEMLAVRSVETEKEQQAIKRVIGQQLDHGCLGPALRLATYFDHRPCDLVLVQTCLNLAEGRISSHQADDTLRNLSHLRMGDCRKRRLSCLSVRRPSFAGSDHEDLEEELVSKEILEALEHLRDACIHGSGICSLILTYFRVASVLDLNFTYIMEHPSVFVVLKMLLKSSAVDKFVLARELLAAHAILDTKVAEFVAEEMLSSLRVLTGSYELYHQEFISNPSSEATNSFLLLISLCREPLLVGNHLLDVAKNTDADAFCVQVELCVLAHHCFSLACSTEGITRVLGRAKLLATTLADRKEYYLMVRLLTGVGRYSELTCILDLLLENDQFELLLKKGMEKISDLKMALLDYLRRYHSSDKEMFTMVALHFLLYREIGEMHEHEAQTKLQALILKPLDTSRATIEQLEHVMQFWADAAESYHKADCPRLAQRCCRHASLVALQLHLLPSGVRLVNLSPAEVNDLIISHSNFLEACVVADVYSEHRVWPQAFYNHVIVRGNMAYLQDFYNHLGVSSSLIQDVVCRFKKEENPSDKMAENMKRVIRLSKDVSVLHRLALDMNFQEVATQVLEGDGGAYICDTFTT